VSDARETCRGISCAVGFESALKMKAETFSIRRCHILFAENLIVEKRRESLHVSECRGRGKPVI
jgi:hypothetical protein